MPELLKRYLVVNNEFNRANYPGLVGLIFANPPSYVQVTIIEVQAEPFVDSPGHSEYHYSNRSEHE